MVSRNVTNDYVREHYKTLMAVGALKRIAAEDEREFGVRMTRQQMIDLAKETLKAANEL